MIISGAAITNTGLQRSANQDCVVAGGWKEQRSMSVPYFFSFNSPSETALAIADGMGGHRGGEIASDLAAARFRDRAPLLKNSDDVTEFLKDLNRSMFEAAARDVQLAGMGTTVAGFLCRAEGLIWFNIGDSKLFRYRDGYLRQLSVDDVSRVVRVGARKPGLTQAIGGAPGFVDVEPHIGVDPLVSGWRYLLCSDGLTDVVSVPKITETLDEADEVAVTRLLEAALAEGAPDNVSIILVTIEDETNGIVEG